MDSNSGKFTGTVEVDETYMGGLERNKHESKKLHQGRGATGKTAVVGVKNRESNKVKAKVIESTKCKTLHGFINRNVKKGSTVCTDDFESYRQMQRYNHLIIKHIIGEYVNEQAHTNGMESLWSMLKRSYKGTYHKMSVKHLHRYVNEFAGRHNIRDKDTILQMTATAHGMIGKQLKYDDLTSGIE